MIDRRAVRVDAPDDVALPVKQRTFLHQRADRIAVQIQNDACGSHVTDKFVVFQHGAVRADASENAASRADGDTRLHRAADDVFVAVDDQSPRQSLADDGAVFVDDAAVRQNDAERTPHAVHDAPLRHQRAERFALQIDNRAVGVQIAYQIACFVDNAAVRQNFADDVALFVVHVARRNRRADDVAVQINDCAVAQSLADDVAVRVDDASVRQNRADDFAVRSQGDFLPLDDADDVTVRVHNGVVGLHHADFFAVQTDGDAVFVGVPDRFAVQTKNQTSLVLQIFNHRAFFARRTFHVVANAAHTCVDCGCGNGNDDFFTDDAESFVAPAHRQIVLNGARLLGLPAHDDVANRVAGQDFVRLALVFQRKAVFLDFFKIDGNDADLARRTGQRNGRFRLGVQHDLIETDRFGGRHDAHRRFFGHIDLQLVAARPRHAGRHVAAVADGQAGVFLDRFDAAHQNNQPDQKREQRSQSDEQNRPVCLFQICFRRAEIFFFVRHGVIVSLSPCR